MQLARQKSFAVFPFAFLASDKQLGHLEELKDCVGVY